MRLDEAQLGYPAATAEAWVDGHIHAFAFFGKAPLSVLYDTDRCLVSKILPDGTRQRATLFEPGSCRITCSATATGGKGNDKGKVEGNARPRPCRPQVTAQAGAV